VNRLELTRLVCIEEPNIASAIASGPSKLAPAAPGRKTPSDANIATVASRSRAFKASFKARTVMAVVSFFVFMLAEPSIS